MPNIIMCDPKGSDPNDTIRKLFANTLTEYVDDTVTQIVGGSFADATTLTTIRLHNLERIYHNAFAGCGVTKLALPKWAGGQTTGRTGGYIMQNTKFLQELDIGPDLYEISVSCFTGCSALNVLVLRKSDGVVNLVSTNAFSYTCFASGKTGGTLYVPSALVNSYKAASNWADILGYGNGEQNSILAIEGSYYATHYADGTNIPSA